MEQFQSSILELIKFQIQSQKEQQEKFQQQILELKQDNDKKQLEISELIHKAILTKENKSDAKFCSQNTIWSTIETFNYNPEEDQTFERFYQKYQDLFDIDCQTWTDEKKIRHLLLKLGTNVFNPILSLFHNRWKCLNIPPTKNESEDFTTYASVINKTCNDFRLSKLTADNFKCLIFVLRQVSRKDSDMRRRILTKPENEQNMSLQQLADYCQEHVNIKPDPQRIKEAGIANVRRIWKSPASTNKNHYRKKFTIAKTKLEVPLKYK